MCSARWSACRSSTSSTVSNVSSRSHAEQETEYSTGRTLLGPVKDYRLWSPKGGRRRRTAPSVVERNRAQSVAGSLGVVGDGVWGPPLRRTNQRRLEVALCALHPHPCRRSVGHGRPGTDGVGRRRASATPAGSLLNIHRHRRNHVLSPARTLHVPLTRPARHPVETALAPELYFRVHSGSRRSSVVGRVPVSGRVYRTNASTLS